MRGPKEFRLEKNPYRKLRCWCWYHKNAVANLQWLRKWKGAPDRCRNMDCQVVPRDEDGRSVSPDAKGGVHGRTDETLKYKK